MKYIYLIILLLLISCSAGKPLKTQKLTQQITYFVDERTGLCFAALLSVDPFEQNQIKSIIVVPCNNIK